MPTLINPCCATPRVSKTPPSKKRKIIPLNSSKGKYDPIIEPPTRNSIQTTVKLLDAANKIDIFVKHCKDVVGEIKKLPRGVNTTKMCNELTSLLDHFEGEVASVLKAEIIPKVRSVGSISYVFRRLKHAAS